MGGAGGDGGGVCGCGCAATGCRRGGREAGRRRRAPGGSARGVEHFVPGGGQRALQRAVQDRPLPDITGDQPGPGGGQFGELGLQQRAQRLAPALIAAPDRTTISGSSTATTEARPVASAVAYDWRKRSCAPSGAAAARVSRATAAATSGPCGAPGASAPAEVSGGSTPSSAASRGSPSTPASSWYPPELARVTSRTRGRPGTGRKPTSPAPPVQPRCSRPPRTSAAPRPSSFHSRTKSSWPRAAPSRCSATAARLTSFSYSTGIGRAAASSSRRVGECQPGRWLA